MNKNYYLFKNTSLLWTNTLDYYEPNTLAYYEQNALAYYEQTF